MGPGYGARLRAIRPPQPPVVIQLRRPGSGYPSTPSTGYPAMPTTPSTGSSYPVPGCGASTATGGGATGYATDSYTPPMPASYSATPTYGTPSSYGTPGGYGTPSSYGTPGSYGTRAVTAQRAATAQAPQRRLPVQRRDTQRPRLRGAVTRAARGIGQAVPPEVAKHWVLRPRTRPHRPVRPVIPAPIAEHLTV